MSFSDGFEKGSLKYALFQISLGDIKFQQYGVSLKIVWITQDLLISPAVNYFCLSIERGVAQSVERSSPGEKVPGSIPAVAARSLLVGSVSV